MDATDREALTSIVEARGGFGHREHVELAWTYLQMHPTDRAAEAMVVAISHLARVARNPQLLDPTLLGHFYSRELIGSARARAGWSEPDLRALPALA